MLDRIIALLSDVHLYPSLKQIVITGHSAGGQTVQRYALVSREHTNTPIDEFRPISTSVFRAAQGVAISTSAVLQGHF